MAVICTGEGRVLTVNVTGEVDHHHARTIMTEMEQAVGAALPRQLILDLSGVTFMDSSGIAVLLRAYRRASEIGAAVRVRKVITTSFTGFCLICIPPGAGIFPARL